MYICRAPHSVVGGTSYIYIILYAARWWHTVIVRVDRTKVVHSIIILLLFVSPMPDNTLHCPLSIMGVRKCDIVCDRFICSVAAGALYLYITYITYVYNTRAEHSVHTWEPHQYALKSPSLAYYAAETIASGAHVIYSINRRVPDVLPDATSVETARGEVKK